jgi:small subunit ribosomal protein S10
MPSSKKKEEKSQEIRKWKIKIKAYDNRLVDNSARQIQSAILRQGGEVIGPVPLPTEIKKYTVNRSTFVHKDAREQFEMRVHKRLIYVINPTPKIVESFQTLNLPAGVEVEIKI